MDIGLTIRKLRLEKGMTQDQLADALGVAMQTVSRWETGVNYPDVIMLPLLAGLFGVSTDFLLSVGGGAPMKTIESARLVIREWSERDAPELYRVNRGLDSAYTYWDKAKCVEDSLETIRIWRKYQEMWPVFRKEDGRLVGVVGLTDVGRSKRYREIEYIIAADAWGCGVATEAVALILGYGFADLDLSIVAASIEGTNLASRRVAEKCGLTYEGTLRRYGRDLSDRARYAITKEEWEAR